MRVLGVDFSGARNAGDKIWVASGRATPGGVLLESCVPARDLPGSGRGREIALPALAAHLSAQRGAWIGLDFPFSLPAPLIRERSWADFVAAFARSFPTAESFRDHCRNATGGKELRRLTDREARAPWCTYNLKLFRQTHAGIRELLVPLLSQGAGVPPILRARAGGPVLVETCPASLLRREGLYKPPYKENGGGETALRRARRAEILCALAGRGLLCPPAPALSEVLVETRDGDALDAAIAAIGAMRAMRDPTAHAPRSDVERLEARIFF